MDTIFNGLPEFDKIFYNAGAVTKTLSNPVTSTLKELIEKDRRIQEKEEKNRLADRQAINSFLRNMIKWVKFDGD